MTIITRKSVYTGWKKRCLAGLLLTTSLCASAVAAQDTADQEPSSQETVDFRADKITYDADTGEVRAVGHVTLVRDGYTLLAGEIRYNDKTGEALADGAVELTSPDGTRIVAPSLTLSENLTRAFVEDIRLIMEDGGQVAARIGHYDNTSGTTTLERAVYSPCKVCVGDPDDEPLWQIKAVKVIHDKGKRRLYYEDAFLEFLGVPVLWTPKFSHPDPTVERASGFLPIQLKTSKELGIVVGLPYHYVFSQSRDLTLTPIMTTSEGPVLAGEYRHHLKSGKFTVDGSITYADKRNIDNVKTGGQELRGHISAGGQFDHSDRWRSTFDLNWASDDTYLRRYDFSYVDTLINDYKLEGFFGNSYVSTRALAFQGLRVEDISGLTAYALPLIDAEFIPKTRPLGGTVRVKGNALALSRLDGLDTQRITASVQWDRRLIANNGIVLDLNATVRSDAYNIDNVETPDDPAYVGTGGSDWRSMARLSARASWPLLKVGDASSQTLEPIVEVTVAPTQRSTDTIVNEDSRAFELSDLNVFSLDRPSGYDLWEDGSRATFGLQWAYEANNMTANVMIGQSWRLSGDNTGFFIGTGLEGDSSDIVGRTKVSYKDWLSIDHRYRIDDSSFALRRNEVNATFGKDGRTLQLGYFKLNRNLIDFARNDRADREEIRANALYRIDDNWRLSASIIQDLTNGSDGVEYGAGVTYLDECIEISLQVRETFTRDRDIEPGTSVLFRLKLKNLG